MIVRLRRPAVVVFALVVSATARAQVPSPTIEGPIASPAGAFIGSAGMVDLSKVGYEQQEYFISGRASAYTSTGPLGDDGMWSVAPGATAEYKTRILVYRPTKPKKFSGTVLVEWLNVGGGVGAVRRRRGWRRPRWPRHQPAAQDGESRPLRVASPSRRRLLVRHLLASRSGGPDAVRAEPARHTQAEARDCGRGVAVGLPARELRQRDPPDRARLRRLLHPQPRRAGRPHGAA